MTLHCFYLLVIGYGLEVRGNLSEQFDKLLSLLRVILLQYFENLSPLVFNPSALDLNEKAMEIYQVQLAVCQPFHRAAISLLQPMVNTNKDWPAIDLAEAKELLSRQAEAASEQPQPPITPPARQEFKITVWKHYFININSSPLLHVYSVV